MGGHVVIPLKDVDAALVEAMVSGLFAGDDGTISSGTSQRSESAAANASAQIGDDGGVGGAEDGGVMSG